MVNRFKILPFCNVIFYVLMVSINIFANTLPINGIPTGKVSAEYFNLLTPVSYAFSIWGAIYILLGLYVLFCAGLFSLGSKKDRAYIDNDDVQSQELDNLDRQSCLNIGYLFSLSCILNSLWLIAWHYDSILLSTLIMIGLLYTLINIYLKNECQSFESIKEKIFIRLPFRLYLGWIMTAAALNITTLLVKLDFTLLFSDQIWAIIVMGILSVLTIIMLFKYNDIVIPFVIVWSIFAIMIRHIIELDAQFTAVIVACGVYIIAICGFVVRRISDV